MNPYQSPEPIETDRRKLETWDYFAIFAASYIGGVVILAVASLATVV